VWSSICIRLVQGYIVGSQTGATRFAGHKGLLGVLDLHWAEAQGLLTCHTVVVFIGVIMGGGLVYNVADGVLLKSLAFGKSLVFLL